VQCAIDVTGETMPHPADTSDILDFGPALVVRSDRALLEVRGDDRSAWLHNLTTNQVHTLSPGEGNYAFVLNLQGRILFDLNLVVRTDCVWVDLNRGFLEVAIAHFEKYRITEDIQVEDRSDAFDRLALVGNACVAALSKMGASHIAKIPQMAMVEVNWRDATMYMMRNDFCGPFAVDIFVPMAKSIAFRAFLTDAGGPVAAQPVSMDEVHVRRIESGIPWSCSDISDEYLPAETGQLEKGVSFNKGCYLGQEVVERMRSRGVQARRLVGLTFAAVRPPANGSELLLEDGKPVGTVTSVCQSPSVGRPIGLGYVKTACAKTGLNLHTMSDGERTDGVVVDLPFARKN
jgi:folate-binding protein YgfZ